MYEIVVVEMTSPSTTVKYFKALPPVIAKASTMTAVAAIPEQKLTTIGVPNRAENLPMNRGAAPSSAAIAWARSAPMIQVVPLVSSASTKATAIT
jgi:hypothetical protein